MTHPSPVKSRAVSTVITPRFGWHRRIGLSSLGLTILGGGWIALAVLPGLERAQKSHLKEKEPGKAKEASVLGGNPLAWVGTANESTKVVATPSAASTATPAPMAIGSIKVAFINAPIGQAIQTMLASAMFSAVCDPAVSGTVNYTNLEGKPFWVVLGSVIGSAPKPGVQMLQTMEAVHILRRDADVMAMRYGNAPTATMTPPAPVPVPLGDGRIVYRMAGYVELIPNNGQKPFPVALCEVRIPGNIPHYLPLRLGEALFSRVTFGKTRDTNPGSERSPTPVVESIEPGKFILLGQDGKRLTVSLSISGVADIWGTTVDDKGSAAPITAPTDRFVPQRPAFSPTRPQRF